MSDLRLMVPGPVDAEEDVLSAISEQTLPHYGPQWMQVFNETTEMLQKLFETEGDVLMMPGPGTGALDSAVSSLVPRGQSVAVLDNGFFGYRFAQIIEKNDLRPWVIKADWGKPVTSAHLREQLQAFVPQAEADGQPLRAVAIVHHETSTGVLNPLAELAAVAQEFDLAVIVDAVASFGGVRIPVDDWGIDICVSVPNKCLGVPPGFALMSVSNRAWQMAENNPDQHGWYLDLRTWRWYMDNWGDWHPYPTTMPTNNIVALHRGLQTVFNTGRDAFYQRFATAAERVRAGLGELGFSLFPDPEYASPTISAMNARDDLDVGDMLTYLREEHNLMVSGGLAELKGKIFRVGHMGKANNPETVDAFLDAVRAYVSEEIPV